MSDNRHAGHDYHLLERFEAGLALTGTEVKAAKAGKVQLRDAYGSVEKGEAWLLNAHISEYSHGNRFNHSPTRPRKLLLHRRELDRSAARASERGLTLVPTRIYFAGAHAKAEIALARGKDLYDKRQTLREKDTRRDIERGIREARR